MGLILLDLTFRVEHAFKIRIPRNWPAQLGLKVPGDDVTLGQYLEYIAKLCEEQGVDVPDDAWSRLRKIASDACTIDERKLSRDTRLIEDIAPNG